MPRELIIYTDESDKKGPFFSNFYGGALIRSADLESVIAELRTACRAQHLHGEVKWQKVTSQYLEKYIAIVDSFFDLIEQGTVKVRIMFTQEYRVPVELTSYHRENAYHLLYYQFLKHAFGLEYSNEHTSMQRIRLYMDQLPDTREKNATFKGFVRGLEQYPPFRRARLSIPADQIAEVKSHDHVALQLLDVVLGAMQFRLNDKHLLKPVGQPRRGKRTIAKEKLYKHINSRIRGIYPGFNIGITTGLQGNQANRWTHPYRHWCFTPSQWEAAPDKTK